MMMLTESDIYTCGNVPCGLQVENYMPYAISEHELHKVAPLRHNHPLAQDRPFMISLALSYSRTPMT